MSSNFEVTIKLKNTGEIRKYETDTLIFALNTEDKVSAGVLYDDAAAIDVALVVAAINSKIKEILDKEPDLKFAVGMIEDSRELERCKK